MTCITDWLNVPEAGSLWTPPERGCQTCKRHIVAESEVNTVEHICYDYKNESFGFLLGFKDHCDKWEDRRSNEG